MRTEPMSILRRSQFAAEEPLQVERIHAPHCIVNAALLFIFSRFSLRCVTVEIYRCRYLSADSLRFIKERGGLKSRNNFVPQLSQPISFPSSQETQVLELGGRIQPFGRPAVIEHVFQH